MTSSRPDIGPRQQQGPTTRSPRIRSTDGISLANPSTGSNHRPGPVHRSFPSGGQFDRSLSNNLKRQRRKLRFHGLQLNTDRTPLLLPIQLARSRTAAASSIFHHTTGDRTPLGIQNPVFDRYSTALSKDRQTGFVFSGNGHQDPQSRF